MKDFQRKRKIRKTLYSRWVLIGVFILLMVISKATLGLYAKERESRKNLDRVESDLSALTLREEKLRTDIARLQTSEGIDAEIREQFQVAKPGERMVVLIGDEKTVSDEPVKERSLVSKFFDLFR
ncbi:MAG: hypothetical protein Q7R64_04835 [bacterium]|nr:hypothetical protein [bacterium]